MNNKQITGIVLAGGKSSRMGRDKAIMPYKGKPLIAHATDLLKTVCTRVVISAIDDRYSFTGLESWPDAIPVQSAMTGIYSCLSRSESTINIVMSCDMPLVNSAFLSDLLNKADAASIIIPVHDDNCYEPLCAIYNKGLSDSMKAAIGSGLCSLRDFIFLSDHMTFICEKSIHYTTGMFINVNTADDFDLLVKS